MTIYETIDSIIDREGGYVDHPADRGGPTKYGVTQATLSAYRSHPVTVTEVQALTLQEARQIYYDRYWIKSGFADLNIATPVQDLLLDTAIHHGVSGATKLLQKAVGAKPDGVAGPITKATVNAMRSDKLAAAMVAERVAKLGRIITDNPTQAAFAAGWMNRMREFITKIPEL